MAFFLRNISISAFVLAILIGSAAVYLSARLTYETTLNQVLTERILLLHTLGRTALEDTSPETLNSTSTSSSDAIGSMESLQPMFDEFGLGEPGVESFRLVDAGTQKILASIEPSERGSAILERLPASSRGQVSLEVRREKQQPIVELTYLGSRNRLLWMSIDRSFFINPAIVAGLQESFLLMAAFGLFALLFGVVIRHFFMRPVWQLKQVLISVEEEGKEPGKDSAKESLGELLESFSDVTRRIESTIEHDRVVSRTKSDFISTTAHQLRTPLSGINWALGSLLSSGENLTDEQRTLLGRSAEKTKELIGIVGELLNTAGIQEGRFGFHREEVSLREEIKKTMEEERQMAEKNKISLRFDYDDEDPAVVYVDRERIRWVIRNLIENAIRYGKEGGSVVVTLAKEKRQLTLSVKDNGMGIPPEDQRHIFERFFRSAAARRKRNDGSGLGLFIVKNIINYHGGRIWFESIEGVGTTFYFTIPLSQSLASHEDT